jgi:hypothetical protein
MRVKMLLLRHSCVRDCVHLLHRQTACTKACLTYELQPSHSIMYTISDKQRHRFVKLNGACATGTSTAVGSAYRPSAGPKDQAARPDRTASSQCSRSKWTHLCTGDEQTASALIAVTPMAWARAAQHALRRSPRTHAVLLLYLP